MNRKADSITPETLAQFDKMRRGIISRRFDDSKLFELYGLPPKYAAFAREFALTNNSFSASRAAGYSENTTRKNTARLVKKTAQAVKVIKEDLANIGIEFQKGLSEYIANGLIDIFENRLQFPGAAVYAARELRRIYIEDKALQTPENLENVTDIYDERTDEILEECYKMGIYEKK